MSSGDHEAMKLTTNIWAGTKLSPEEKDCLLKDTKSGGTKFDAKKPPISIVPREFVEATAKAFAYGAGKYGRDNFKKGIEVTRTIDAALRHIFAFLDGEELDPESLEGHLSHASASLAMTIYNLKHHPELDDRYKAS